MDLSSNTEADFIQTPFDPKLEAKYIAELQSQIGYRRVLIPDLYGSFIYYEGDDGDEKLLHPQIWNILPEDLKPADISSANLRKQVANLVHSLIQRRKEFVKKLTKAGMEDVTVLSQTVDATLMHGDIRKPKKVWHPVEGNRKKVYKLSLTYINDTDKEALQDLGEHPCIVTEMPLCIHAHYLPSYDPPIPFDQNQVAKALYPRLNFQTL